MNTSELKANLHHLIDQIENVHLLEDYYHELNKLVKSPASKIWDKLTEEEKQEVLLSYEESENDENLIVNEEVMNKYKKWLK